MKKLTIIIAALVLMTSCTANSRAKNWGGKEELTLKQNEVLINTTWKGDELWIQTLDTTSGIQYFREKSSWGVWEGEIVFKPLKK